MRIAVNTRLLLKNRMEGIGWFTYETLRRMVAAHPEHQFFFLFDRTPHPDFVFASNVTPITVFPPTRHPALWYLWFEWALPLVFKKLKPDLFLSPDGYVSLRSSVACLPVIHDINFVHYPSSLPRTARWYYNHYFPLYARKAQRIATVSEYSKNDIAKTFGVPLERIDVVYNGSNSNYRPLSDEEKTATRARYTNGHEYFVFVGALHPRKNVARLLQAFDVFRKKTMQTTVKMVIVGNPMFMTTDVEQTLRQMTFASDVVFTGHLAPDQLSNVLGSALALTFVPYFEGFGIPMVEAMYAETPVIAANVTSMPEIAQDAALLVNPFDVTQIADAMLQIHDNKSMRNLLVERGRLRRQAFSWDKTAQNLWHSIEKTIIPH